MKGEPGELSRAGRGGAGRRPEQSHTSAALEGPGAAERRRRRPSRSAGSAAGPNRRGTPAAGRGRAVTHGEAVPKRSSRGEVQMAS